jgi:hypothetical protein
LLLLLTQLVPSVLVVQRLRSRQRHLDVAALQRQVEARRLVSNKVQCNLHSSSSSSGSKRDSSRDVGDKAKQARLKRVASSATKCSATYTAAAAAAARGTAVATWVTRQTKPG